MISVSRKFLGVSYPGSCDNHVSVFVSSDWMAEFSFVFSDLFSDFFFLSSFLRYYNGEGIHDMKKTAELKQ